MMLSSGARLQLPDGSKGEGLKIRLQLLSDSNGSEGLKRRLCVAAGGAGWFTGNRLTGYRVV